MVELIKNEVSKILKVKEEDVNILEKLKGGMSNHMYVIEVNGLKYTFRIPGKKANNFVDREKELENIKLVEKLEVNNEMYYFDEVVGYKLSKYVEGECLIEKKVEDYLVDVSEILRKVHNSELRSKYDYDCMGRLSKYEKLVTDKGYIGKREKYYELKKKLESDFSFLQNGNLVLCHGDSQVSNFVVGEDKLYLLDWEFCGNNDPIYDIACFGNVDFEDALKLLPIYLGREPNAIEISKLNYFRGFQCLQWHNVALYKDLIGLSEELSVPFLEISEGYLVKAEKFLEDARIKMNIENEKDLLEFEIFKVLGPDMLEKMSNVVYTQTIEAEELIYSSNVCKGILIIKEGKFRVYMVSETGREITLFYAEKGDTLALAMNCMSGSMPISVHVKAIQDSIIYKIDNDEFLRFHRSSFELQKFIIENMTKNMNEVMWVIEQVAFNSIDKRVAGYLLDLDQNIIYKTHKEIGNELGTAREVVSRMLKYFEQLGHIEITRGKIYIKEKEELEKIVRHM